MDGNTDPVIYEWAMVELFGHRKHYGRTCEVERFGTKLLRIDVPLAAAAPLLGEPETFETHFYGGSAIFSFTPMTEEAVRKWADRYRPVPYEPIARLPYAGAASEPDDDPEADRDTALYQGEPIHDEAPARPGDDADEILF